MGLSRFKPTLIDEDGPGMISKRTRIVRSPSYKGRGSPQPPVAPTYDTPGAWPSSQSHSPHSQSSTQSSVFSSTPSTKQSGFSRRSPSIKTMFTQESSPQPSPTETNYSTDAIFNDVQPQKTSFLKRMSSEYKPKPKPKKAPKTRSQWAGLPPREALPPRVVRSQYRAVDGDGDELPLCGPWR
ncbi:hypothetical protein DICA1_D21220 [Diutina catenulata]